MDDNRLTLHKMTIDGIPYDDDWLVMWRKLPIGRILRKSGVAWGQPGWWWGINFDGRPQTENMRSTGRDLTECQAAFETAWATYRVKITDIDVARARRREAAAERRVRH
ncbi:MAG: hypothetical protein CFE29_20780 [Bradyrhizobiaceae bacterium PARB1]|nr:MAG: hypothetical protein CFE29_20780 [Bradyrhizobiaceae bacterium PARB1]